MEHRAQEGERRAVRLKKLLDTPHYYRNVIEITVTSTSLLAGMLYAFSIYGWIRHLILPAVSAGEEISVIPLAAAMVFVTVFLIYLMVLFSILVPKKIAGRLGEASFSSNSMILEIISTSPASSTPCSCPSFTMEIISSSVTFSSAFILLNPKIRKRKFEFFSSRKTTGDKKR